MNSLAEHMMITHLEKEQVSYLLVMFQFTNIANILSASSDSTPNLESTNPEYFWSSQKMPL